MTSTGPASPSTSTECTQAMNGTSTTRHTMTTTTRHQRYIQHGIMHTFCIDTQEVYSHRLCTLYTVYVHVGISLFDAGRYVHCLAHTALLMICVSKH